MLTVGTHIIWGYQNTFGFNLSLDSFQFSNIFSHFASLSRAFPAVSKGSLCVCVCVCVCVFIYGEGGGRSLLITGIQCIMQCHAPPLVYTMLMRWVAVCLIVLITTVWKQRTFSSSYKKTTAHNHVSQHPHPYTMLSTTPTHYWTH